MLPLKPLSVISPKTMPELKQLFTRDIGQYKIIAGGTDVLPNLKHGLYDVDVLLSLNKIPELRSFQIHDNNLTANALLTLEDIASDKIISTVFPALAKAAQSIASPQIRNMGTIGGNICLDTRCLYINQTQFWRTALGYCLKKDGSQCHVVPTGKRCVAASSNDLATVLLAYDASVTIISSDESFEIKLSEFYTANGVKNNILKPYEMVSSVSVPIRKNCYAGFYKLRFRNSIDFPLLSVATCFSLDGTIFTEGRLIVNALVARPKIIDLAQWSGSSYNTSLVEEIAAFAEDKCHPQTNICGDTSWRKQMIRALTKEAFNNAACGSA